MNKSRQVALILIMISVVFALFGAAMRWRAERNSRMVGIALDDQQVLQIAADSGSTPISVLRSLRRAGATSIAISEISIGDLLTTGDAQWRNPNCLMVSNSNLIQRFAKRLNGHLSWSAYPGKPMIGNLYIYAPAPQGGIVSFQTSISPNQLSQTMVGLDRRLVAAAHETGMQVVARFRNSPVAAKDYIRSRLDDAAACDAGIVIFSADEVLGFRDLLNFTRDQMKAREQLYGSIEMGKQKGDQALTAKMHDCMVRVHSIPVAEMGTLTPAEMLDRYERAAKERNIRLCYVRIPSVTNEDPQMGMVNFISELKASLEHGGMGVGRPKPVLDLSVPPIVNALAGAAGLVALLMLLESLFVLPGNPMLTLLVFLVGTVLGLSGQTGLKICALSAAIAMPSLGVISIKLTQECRCAPIKHAIQLLLTMSLWGFVGALLVIGSLAHIDFMVKANQFAGIKFAHIAPILAAAWYWGLNVNDCTSPKQLTERIKQLWKNIAGYPITVGLATGLMLGLVIIAVVLMRTGNEPGVGVSPIEMKFRSLLEWIMVVRPRTKEFLIGHPAMVLAITLAALGRPKWWWMPLLLLGALGQASLVNTFCHIHTPLAISFIRMVYGVVLGAIIGYILSRFAVYSINKAEAKSES